MFKVANKMSSNIKNLPLLYLLLAQTVLLLWPAQGLSVERQSNLWASVNAAKPNSMGNGSISFIVDKSKESEKKDLNAKQPPTPGVVVVWPSALTSGQQPDRLRADHCSGNEHCKSGISCDSNIGLCGCPAGYISSRDFSGTALADQINWPPSHCYRAAALFQPCLYDEQCLQPNSRCTRDEHYGPHLCACAHGFVAKGQPFTMFQCYNSFTKE